MEQLLNIGGAQGTVGEVVHLCVECDHFLNGVHVVIVEQFIHHICGRMLLVVEIYSGGATYC